jgi:hypothetical protein
VLGSNVTVIQPLGFFLRVSQHAPGPLGESIKFVSHTNLLP